MKKVLVLLCTILCANVLMAQTFWVDSLQYHVTSTSPAEVEVYDAYSSITIANIPAIVSYYGTTYSVTSIGQEAFEYCSSLTSVDIPNGVTSIGIWAFYNCSSLTSVNIGNGVTSIGYEAFYNCSSLTSIDIPNSVTSIGSYAFRYCTSLTTLNFNAINCSDFNYVTNYSPIYPPFYNLPITTINIGDSVQRIPAYFAYSLDSLTSVTIGNSVTEIGTKAFEGCSSLQNITCLATTSPTLEDNTVFPNPNTATLIVPCGSSEHYSTSTWNIFFADRIS